MISWCHYFRLNYTLFKTFSALCTIVFLAVDIHCKSNRYTAPSSINQLERCSTSCVKSFLTIFRHKKRVTIYCTFIFDPFWNTINQAQPPRLRRRLMNMSTRVDVFVPPAWSKDRGLHLSLTAKAAYDVCYYLLIEKREPLNKERTAWLAHGW